MRLDETHRQIRNMARRFAGDVIRPIATEFDQRTRLPRELYEEIGKLGLFGIAVSEVHGDTGFDVPTDALVTEELSRGYASVADIGFVLASIDPDAGHLGMSVFAVDLRAEGVERGQPKKKTGKCANQVGALSFSGVRLEAEDLIGKLERGFHMVISVFDKGRVGIGAPAVCNALSALNAALDYAIERKQFGKIISEFQNMQRMLADMAKDIEAARFLVRSAAGMLDDGERSVMACSMAKFFAGDLAVSQTSDAFPVFGGTGYRRGFEIKRLYRDDRITQVQEGTNEIQRSIIARELLPWGATA